MNRHRIYRPLVIASLIVFSCIFARFAESGETQFNLSQLPTPKVKLPALPDDGSGIYRLNLDQALGKAPLTVVLEVQQGKVVRAVGLPVRTSNAWCPVDGSRLKFEARR